ncbi:DegT/DnrJ/EryC1/StrS family aminotransferase [Oscillochloris sp. ZM17-4]|uniref:DegT/DnrJ/EryC1/StrS family aminotransferase n=1 Tax=Oscillochloris sp. ZM17-4 TaxID=2866714 RepID=UPI001C733DFB|nr:DegT/DnrJ/EryC1/StrS family aminotransferase [Oscillochloris sp. ZM17-4]MBX0330468.1 DegT/DnrJ/EryC1/StrS family aminotransferase [Oscillochloris sp. ZM17-4]
MIATDNIAMSSPDLTDAEIAAVLGVLQTPVLSIGPKNQAFEHAFRSYTGTQHATSVNSGTSGLHLCMIAAGVEEGDIVITTPFSFIASANCILYERATPVFVDVDPATGNINPALVAEAAEGLSRGGAAARRWLPPALRYHSDGPIGPRLKAILPVHAFGQPADMDPILTVARRHGLSVIEDACEAIGAEYKGHRAGTLGDAAVFAFYPNKQMTTGEGGMIVTNHEHWNDLFRSLRNQGRDVFDAWLNHTRLGYNYRLDELSAALGLTQIQRIEELLARRDQVAAWYNERLAGAELIERPAIVPSTTRMSWFVYVVRLNAPADRNEVMRQLSEAGIPSRPYFTPIHLQPIYLQRLGYQPGDFPVTERLGDVSLALPFSGVMTEDQVDYVCHHLRACTAI